MEPSEIPLRDIHLPDPVSWWPLAPGLWVLFGAVTIVLGGLAALYFWRKHRAVHRAALSELTAIEVRFREHANTDVLTRDLSRLTRRTVLALDPDGGAIAATGSSWAQYLDRLKPNGAIDPVIKEALIDAPYQRGVTIDGEALLRAMWPWLTALRAPPTEQQR